MVDIMTAFPPDQSVTQVRFDYAVTLLTDDGTQLRVESRFALRESASGDSLFVDPERAGPYASKIVALLGKRIVESVIEPGGSIEIEFEGGINLRVEPDAHYEAWDLNVGDGSKAVCLPGGGLAIWDPKT